MKKMIWAMVLMLLSSTAFAESMKTYYPNGKVQMESSDTMTKMYYENGQVSMETPMQDGQPAGITKMYFPSGKLMREENLSTKTWKQYNEDGSVQAEGTN